MRMMSMDEQRSITFCPSITKGGIMRRACNSRLLPLSPAQQILRRVTLVSNNGPNQENAPVMSSGDVVRQFFASEVANLLRFDPVAREGENPEGVHQLRVSSRRLRADLTVMSSVFHPRELDFLHTELGWLGKKLGQRRDLDIRVALLKHVRRDMPRWVAGQLLEGLQQLAYKEDEKIQRLLNADRYRHLMATLAEAVVRPPLNQRAATPATDVLGPGLCDALSILVARVETVGPTPTYDQLHEIRILAKRVRYSAALSSPLFGLHAKSMANSLEQVQTLLGELHDRVLVMEYFTRAFDGFEGEQSSLENARAGIERRLTREIKRLNSQWRQPYDEARRQGTFFLSL